MNVLVPFGGQRYILLILMHSFTDSIKDMTELEKFIRLRLCEKSDSQSKLLSLIRQGIKAKVKPRKTFYADRKGKKYISESKTLENIFLGHDPFSNR